ncbi:MAG: AAA family ATPase [Oscillospiraceae bacterium]|nr:AAA family ATPase [Oscillospiraceae bacterium]
MTEDNCRVYACVNQKGGVGKSVTSTNLGIGLARNGEKVLIVDLDSQASQTVSLGWKEPDELLETIATQLTRVMENKPFDPRDGILSHGEGVRLMPSSIALSGVEMRLVNAMSRELILKKYLAAMRPDYDAIVLDCPPTLGMMTINALAAADRVIVPVQPEYLSVIGMTQLFETIGLVKENINPNLRVEGVLITLANMRTNLAKNTVEIIKGAYGGNVRVYPEPIPYSTKVKEASAAGKSIFAYEPGGKAAYAYESLVREVMRDAKSRGADLRAAKKSEHER